MRWNAGQDRAQHLLEKTEQNFMEQNIEAEEIQRSWEHTFRGPEGERLSTYGRQLCGPLGGLEGRLARRICNKESEVREVKDQALGLGPGD